MKKVLHICEAPIGGTVEYLRLFLSNYDCDKFQHEIICPSSGNINQIISALNVPIININMVRNISPLKDLMSLRNIRKYVKKTKPDIVYLHSSKAGALGRIATLGVNTKVVYNPHGWAFTIDISKKKKMLYTWIERFLEKYTDIIINISKDEYEQAVVNKVPTNKMRVIYNGIDVSKYKNNKKEKFHNRFVIGFVGRLEEQKNPLFLIELAKEITINNKDILFYIVGEGKLKKEMQEEIQNNNLENHFYFSGWVTSVEKEIRNFDLAILVSKWEGFGLVICEYMAAKKPVISAKVGGAKNIIENNVNGLLIEGYRPADYINKIILLKTNNAKRMELIENGYKNVEENFSIENHMHNIEKIFMEEKK